MSAYSDAVLATAGLVNYWKLGGATTDLKGSATLAYGSDSASSSMGRVIGEHASPFIRGSANSYIFANPSALSGAHSFECLFNIPGGVITNGLYLFGTRGVGPGYSTEFTIDPASNTSLRPGFGNGSSWFNPPPAGGDPVGGPRSTWTKFFKVVVTTAGTCQFINTANNPAIDSYGGIYNDAGTFLAGDDDGAGGSRWVVNPTLAVGTYWVAHTFWGGTTSHEFTVRANPGTAVLDTPTGPFTVPFATQFTALPMPPDTNVIGMLTTSSGLGVFGPGLTRGVWHHVVLAVGANGSWEIILDGVSVGMGIWSLSGSPLLFDASHNLTLGNYSRAVDAGWSMDGKMQHVAIYNTKVDVATAQAHIAVLGDAPTYTYHTGSVAPINPQRVRVTEKIGFITPRPRKPPAPMGILRTARGATAPNLDWHFPTEPTIRSIALGSGGGSAERPTSGQVWPR